MIIIAPCTSVPTLSFSFSVNAMQAVSSLRDHKTKHKTHETCYNTAVTDGVSNTKHLVGIASSDHFLGGQTGNYKLMKIFITMFSPSCFIHSLLLCFHSQYFLSNEYTVRCLLFVCVTKNTSLRD